MEISSISGSGVTKAQLNNDAAKTGGFQEVLDTAMENKDKAKLKKACVEFESYFVQTMLKEMRKTVDSSGGILPKSYAVQIFESMLDEETAKNIANGKGIGIADMMYRQMESTLLNANKNS